MIMDNNVIAGFLRPRHTVCGVVELCHYDLVAKQSLGHPATHVIILMHGHIQQHCIKQLLLLQCLGSHGECSMAGKKREYKLDIMEVLKALDMGDRAYYDGLTDEEKKAYVPLVIMRWMSALPDQNSARHYSVLAVNDLVNVGFWELSKHTELQHLLLCSAGTGRKQFRQWIAAGGRKTKTKKLDEYFLQRHPDAGSDELEILRNAVDRKEFKAQLEAEGMSDKEIKELVEEFKKLEK
jgi:hypothetical protein